MSDSPASNGSPAGSRHARQSRTKKTTGAARLAELTRLWRAADRASENALHVMQRLGYKGLGPTDEQKAEYERAVSISLDAKEAIMHEGVAIMQSLRSETMSDADADACMAFGAMMSR